MTRRPLHLASLLVIALLVASPAVAQSSVSVDRAKKAYDNLDLEGAIANARAAIAQHAKGAELVQAYKLLGYSYSGLDSAAQAINAFQALIELEPDSEPDPVNDPPRIINYYATALSRVMVVRHLHVDSTAVVAGTGRIRIRFQVSHVALVVTRIVGLDVNALVDSSIVATTSDTARYWNGLVGNAPPPSGTYRVIVDAISGSDDIQASTAIQVTKQVRDTLPFITALEGFPPRPEFTAPTRDWTPLGRAALYTGLGAAVAYGAQSSVLGRRSSGQLLAISGTALAIGLLGSLEKPVPRAIPDAQAYNRLLREQIAERNREVAKGNEDRRHQTVIVVVPVRS